MGTFALSRNYHSNKVGIRKTQGAHKEREEKQLSYCLVSRDEEAPEGCENKRFLALEGTDLIMNWKDLEPRIISITEGKILVL